MPVGMLWEWDNPKDDERNKKRLEKSKEVNTYFYKIAEETRQIQMIMDFIGTEEAV